VQKALGHLPATADALAEVLIEILELQDEEAGLLEIPCTEAGS
jgi:hypothetical protein